MIRFSLNGKELKEMIDKVLTVVPKKSSIPALGAVYFKVEDGNLSVFGTDLDQWLEVSSNWAVNTEDGIIGVDIDDIKILTNSKSEVECIGMEDFDELKMCVKTGNKTVNIGAIEYELDNPKVDNGMTEFMDSSECWLYDTFTKLVTFLAPSDSNRLMGAYNINLKDSRVETLDGHRIGTRSIPNGMLRNLSELSYTVNYTANNVFKKLLDKKSNKQVKMFGSKNYVLFEGDGFRYLTRRIDGKYFDINNIMVKHEPTDISFIVNREDMMAVSKYDADLEKEERKPMSIYLHDGNVYCYMNTSRYEVLDKIDAEIKHSDDDFIFAVNPKFVTDALQIMDSDRPFIYGTSPKGAWIFVGDDYNALVLPVNFDAGSYISRIDKCIEDSCKKRA